MPQLITLIDGNKVDNHICVGYKNQFDLINEKNGDTLQMYNVEANKVWIHFLKENRSQSKTNQTGIFRANDKT